MSAVFAQAPPLPKFVQLHLQSENLRYELPCGEFDPYVQQYVKHEGGAQPWAVLADFNGDGGADWAGLLRSPDGRLDLVVVFSDGESYSHNVLALPSIDTNEIYVGVFFEPPGEKHGFPIDEHDPNPTINLEYPGIHLIWFEKASVLFYWNGSTFAEFQTGD